MLSPVTPFTDEEARTVVNLNQRYEVWMDAERRLAALPYDLRRKTVNGTTYLYQIRDRSGNGKSLGRLDDDNQKRFDEYRAQKEELKSRRVTSARSLRESCALYRALRLPLLASPAGEILREADRRQLLDTHLLVVGTNALPAYAMEASGYLNNVPGETEDVDLAWRAEDGTSDTELPFWTMLKAVDSTYTVNTERMFQARNAKAYEVELLVAPSKFGTLGARDKPRPIPLPEQEWLLLGTPVDQVVTCRDGSPARIVAPDPRWFALHKLWMSQQDKRNPLKRGKDEIQGRVLLNAVSVAMQQYPLDAAFEAELPEELLPIYEAWAKERPTEHGAGW